ncbi:CAMK/DAPK/DAPK protein kinase, variant [Aphelenchoides besseyi]|nr:CAMK/DAPK/DAPK protein kinase, variant [Aphelenchoides besseyi]
MATEVINQTTTKLGSVTAIVSELKFNEEPVDRFYEIGDELGSGQFAVVRRVVERSTGEAFAAKFVKKRRYATSRRGVSRENIEREIRVLQTIKGHENVIELHDVFETPNEFVLILELVTGGELFDHVCAHECLDELEAAAFIRQVCYGLLHLHRRHVVHMDIKPENILLKRKNDSHVKLIDFGLSRMILPGETHREMVGTPEFVSPQIVNYEPIGPDVDCWALGVVCYILLSGGSPFLGRTRDETFCNITAVNYHFSSAYFGKVSSQAKDFISRLLVRDVRRRMSIEDALRHGNFCGIVEHSFSFISLDSTGFGRIGGRSSIFDHQLRTFARLQTPSTLETTHRYGSVLCQSYEARTQTNRVGQREVGSRGNEVQSGELIGVEMATFKNVEMRSKITETNDGMNDENDYEDAKIFRSYSTPQIAQSTSSPPSNSLVDVRSEKSIGGRSTCRSASSQDDFITSAILVACEEQNIDALEQLVNVHRLDLNVVNALGETPTHVAAGVGSEKLIAFLQRRGVPTDAEDSRGDTPLFWAARNGHASLIRFMIASKNRLANVNHVNKTGESALHLATSYGQVECALALLECGASVDVVDKHAGESPLHIASWHGYSLLLSILCRFNPRFDLTNQVCNLRPLRNAKENTKAIRLKDCSLGRMHMQSRSVLSHLHNQNAIRKETYEMGSCVFTTLQFALFDLTVVMDSLRCPFFRNWTFRLAAFQNAHQFGLLHLPPLFIQESERVRCGFYRRHFLFGIESFYSTHLLSHFAFKQSALFWNNFKLESRSYARLTTKDPIISSARQSPRTEKAPHILEIASDFPSNDLSSSLATSDEEEIERVVESPQPEFPSEIFVPTTQSDDSALVSASSSTSHGSAMTRSGRSNDSALGGQQMGDSREVVKRILADPERVAASNFNELVHSLTDSLNRNGQTNRPRRDSSTSRRHTRVDPATNPFHPLYASTRNAPKGPILPLEGSSKPPWKEVDFNSPTSNGLFARPSFVPALDTLRPTFNVAASNVEMRLKPSETLVGLSQHNPFRLEAWTEPEERQVATARYTHTQTEDLRLLKRKDVAVGTVGVKDDEEDESYEINGGQVTPDDEYELSTRILSTSAPATTRKPAPCAVAYPSTAVFIRMVNSVLATGMMPPGGKFYVDGCFTDDETALHCAASRGHLECVQSLLESGAPMDARDLTGRTALHHTLSRSHTDIALLLITKGCNVDIADKNGDTALHVAARQGLVTSVQTLCHVGATVDPLNSQSLSPLHVAAREGHVEVVRCLCLSGADVNLQSGDGQTAEMVAIQNDQQTVADLLSKLKADHVRESAMAELCPQDAPLRRIKLKLFGHSEVGKSRLVQSLQSGVMNKFTASLEAVSRRFSDNLGTGTGTTSVSASSASLGDKSNRLSDEGIASCASSISSESDKRAWASNGRRPAHPNYTHGIDVQNANFPGCGEFSCWEFGGYEPFHVIYDLCVGNADCVHVVVVRASDPTEVQYVQVLYWMNFLKGRVTPSEPIGHCGIVSRRSKVVIIGTHATPTQFPDRNTDDTSYTSSDVDAMLKTVRLRFETHFDIHDRLILLDSTNLNCPGLKALRIYLQKARESIVSRLQKPLVLLDNCINYLSTLRKRYATFPVITWPHFVTLVRSDCNPLISDQHARQLIQQLQLLGELVYLRDELSELDYVVLVPDWLTTHILGTLLSAEFLGQCHTNGIYSIEQFGPVFPEITETEQLLHMLDTLQLCVPIDGDGAEDTRYEFPALILNPPPKDYWTKNRPNYIYGGLRILPMRGMERSLQSTFPRIQVGMRRSMHDFQDPLDAELNQYLGSSKMCSGRMEALVRLHGDAVEIQVRGPAQMSASCVYFLEDIANLVEQTASEVAPGIALERHFLSPQQLKEHRSQPASFPPEEIMAMQQRESLSIRNTDGNEELFTDVVCFGSRDVASVLTLGVDVSVSQLQLAARCELASLLDPPDGMASSIANTTNLNSMLQGRDWSILAVKLNLAEQLPEVDSTGQSLSRTDQLLAEWALQQPESASIGKLCSILEEMGRQDARDVLYRTVPLYIFAPVEDAVNGTGSTDSGQ